LLCGRSGETLTGPGVERDGAEASKGAPGGSSGSARTEAPFDTAAAPAGSGRGVRPLISHMGRRGRRRLTPASAGRHKLQRHRAQISIRYLGRRRPRSFGDKRGMWGAAPPPSPMNADERAGSIEPRVGLTSGSTLRAPTRPGDQAVGAALQKARADSEGTAPAEIALGAVVASRVLRGWTGHLARHSHGLHPAGSCRHRR
jgi:hypothetical protein